MVLQNPKGVVLFRRPQSEQKYKAADMQDLLKSDPDYNPKLDPGAPVAPQSPTLGVSTQAATAVLVAGAGAALFLLRRKREPSNS